MELKDFLAKFDRGSPDLDEIGRGMHYSYKNAVSLIDDAGLLLERSPGRAISLAILSWEEIAKIFLLAEAAAKVALGSADWEQIRTQLRLQSHQSKLWVFSSYGKRILSKAYEERGEKLYQYEIPGGLVPFLDKFKQLGFYVDIFEGRFISPQEFGVDNVEWARSIIAAGKERLEGLNMMHSDIESSIGIARAIGRNAEDFAEVKSLEQAEDLGRSLVEQAVKELRKRHHRRVQREARKLKDQGWNVQAHGIRGYDQPDRVAGYIPDIIATKGGRRKIIEVATPETLAAHKKIMEALRRHAAQKRNTDFEPITTRARKRR